MAKTVSQNTFYLTAAYILQKIIAFFYFATITRFISVGQVGIYFFAVSFATIFSVLVDFGLSSVLIRELAKHKEKLKSYLATVVLAKVFLSLLAILGIFISLKLLGYGKDDQLLVLLAGLVIILDSFTLSFYGVLRSRQNLKYEAFGVVIYQFIVISFGFIVLLTTKSVAHLILCLLVASIFAVIYSYFFVKKCVITESLENGYLKNLKLLVNMAFPFFLAGVFNKIYSYIDVILLSRLAGDIYVGWYSASYKMAFAFQFIPSAFVAAIFPAMSSLFISDKEKLKNMFSSALSYLMMIVMPISFGTISLGSEIITLVHGDKYLNSVLPLKFLMLALIFMFLYYPIGSLLGASNRQRINTINMGIAMVISVGLNLCLIPLYKTTGAGIAALAAQAVMFTLGITYCHKLIKFDFRETAKKFTKIIFSASFMSFVVILVKSFFPWGIAFFFAPIVYFIALYALRVVDRSDLMQVFGFLRR